MSNPDYLQSLRDLAQAEQMRSAAESARNSGKLLEAQERQVELEEQKLKIEQLRLQEERNSRIASAKKSETHRAIRVEMTAVEEEIDLLLKKATNGQKHHLVDGLPAVSFFSLLVKKKLKRVILSQSKLEDLGDIRFARSLERRFEELKELHPHYFGEAILQRTRKVFMEVAFWAHETKCFNNQDDSLHEFLQKSGARIDLIALKIDNTLLSTAMIEEFIESIQELKQKTLIAKDKITEAWNIRERQASRLRSCGFGDAEIEFTADAKLDPKANELLNQIHSHQCRIERLEASLLQARNDWNHDRDLLESANTCLLEGKFGEADNAFAQFKRSAWNDLDVSGIKKVLTQKRDSLVREVEALASDKNAAINLAQKLSVEYASSPTITDALKNYQLKLISELVMKKERKRRAVRLAGLLLCGSVVVWMWFFNMQRAKIARIEKERVAAVEQAERAEKERIEKAEHALGELLVGLEAKMLPVPGTKVLLSKTEVTVSEWKLYLKAEGLPDWRQPTSEFEQNDEHPVVNVSWIDAKKFCEWVSKVTGREWRLPTCEEWGAAVGKSKYPWGDYYPPNWNDGNYAVAANGKADPAKVGVDGIKGTAPVGSFKANSLGFYDLGGNVWEWMWDELDTKTRNRVIRGGCWGDPAEYCTVEYRFNCHPESRNYSFGFRVALGSVH